MCQLMQLFSEALHQQVHNNYLLYNSKIHNRITREWYSSCSPSVGKMTGQTEGGKTALPSSSEEELPMVKGCKWGKLEEM